MAEAKSTPQRQGQSAPKDSTLSSLRECDKQILALRPLIRNKMRELNQFEQQVKKLEENKAALLALQPKLQENILQMAKTISTSDTDCLRIKNKLPYLSRRAIADNISRLELQLRSHNYRPREEELVLKEICKLRSSLPLVEVYREHLQGNRGLRNNKMRLVNQRNHNFERLQKMHSTLVAETDRLNRTRRSMEDSERGLEDVLKQKDALIEVAKDKLQKRQKRRQKKMQEQSRPLNPEAAVTVSPRALKRCAPPVKRDAFSLELAACRFLLRYARSLAGTLDGGKSAPAATAAEYFLPCAAFADTTASCSEDGKSEGTGGNMTPPPTCVVDEVATDSERNAEDMDRTYEPVLTSLEENLSLAESVSLNGSKGGKFYSKNKDCETYFVQVKPKNRVHKDRKSKKTIGHPPEIVINFMELGIVVPKTLGDITAAILNIEQKQNHFELLREQVYFEEVMAQRKSEASVTSDGNSGSCDAFKSTMRTLEGITINPPIPVSRVFSSSSLQTDSTFTNQLDFRKRDGLDFPVMGGGKIVPDGNSHVLLPDNFFPIADLNCEDSLRLTLLSPLQAEMKSYCEATKCSLEPVPSEPPLTSFNLPDDPITNSANVPPISSTHSSIVMSDDLLITSASVESPSWVSPTVIASPSISCPANSTPAAVTVAATTHQPASSPGASVGSLSSSVAVSLKCHMSTTSSGSVNRFRDDLITEPLLNLVTTEHVIIEGSTSDALDENIEDDGANIHKNSDEDGNDTCNTFLIDCSASYDVKDDQNDIVDSSKLSCNDSETRTGDDIFNDNSNTTSVLSVEVDDAVNVGTVAVKCSVTPQSDDDSDVESGVCYDEEEPPQRHTTEAIFLLEGVDDTSSSSLDVVGEARGLVSSSISIASSDSGVMVAATSRRHEPDCDPTCSTDSSKSTSSGCSCNCNNVNDDCSDWSNSDTGGLGARQVIISDNDGNSHSNGILQHIVRDEIVQSSNTSSLSLTRTTSSTTSVSNIFLSQPTYATFCASLPSYTDSLQQGNSTLVPASVSCSVVTHSNKPENFHNILSCSTISSSQDSPGNKSSVQSVRHVPTIEISEVSTITDQVPVSDRCSSPSNCIQLLIMQPQTSSAVTHLTSSLSDDAPTTSSVNCEGLPAAASSSALQSAPRRPPTAPITIDRHCSQTIPASASSSNQLLPTSPAAPSPLGTSSSAGFCALSPAHVSAAQTRQQTALVSYADVAKSLVPHN